MDTRTKILLGMAACLAAILILVVAQHARIRELSQSRDKYKTNTELLQSDIEKYRVKDSLNGARVEALEFSVKEFERYRAEDAALIKSLKLKNKDLASVNDIQAQTIIELSTRPRDTLIIRDSIPIEAKFVRCGDQWYDFEGLLTKDEFTGKIACRDSLLIAETIRYKRFLWWKTNKILNRQVDCITKNPHSTILGIEFVVIEK